MAPHPKCPGHEKLRIQWTARYLSGVTTARVRSKIYDNTLLLPPRLERSKTKPPASAVGTSGSPSSGLGRTGGDGEGQGLAGGAFAGAEFRQWEVRLDAVAVAAAVLLLDHVAGLDQVGDDAEGAALGYLQAGRDVAQAHPGVMSDAQQNPGMIGQEGPAHHLNTIPDSGKDLLVFWSERSLKSGTGCQPPATASFPGLPEELMNIGAIVRAHDARNAACRLTMPVSDRRCRARINPGLAAAVTARVPVTGPQ